jgi:hypothetical protein
MDPAKHSAQVHTLRMPPYTLRMPPHTLRSTKWASAYATTCMCPHTAGVQGLVRGGVVCAAHQHTLRMPPHTLRMPLYTQVRKGLLEEVSFTLSNGMPLQHTLRMPPHTLRCVCHYIYVAGAQGLLRGGVVRAIQRHASALA